MTFADAVRSCLDAEEWRTSDEVREALAAKGEEATPKQVHACLLNMLYAGFVEADRPADAPNRYRLARVGEIVSDRDRYAAYLKAFPDGWFTLADLGRIMGVTPNTASRHVRRALGEGVLERRRTGSLHEFRRVRRCSRDSSHARCAEARRSPGGTS